ncbi:acyltransferase family protein [Flavobacterium rhizosphaerae]|uniref:Acyltransferase n=1 Tax=Flavobacterium rhizosphaerae TaxID=3163298 RepID=A0ABW8YZQ1_9FLAO
MATLQQNIRLTQLDGLRGIFALIVAVFHFSHFSQVKNATYLSNFVISQGDLFVDFFFVLSGFVISLNYYNKIHTRADFLKYLKKRFLRLYPLLFYTCIVFVLFMLVAGKLSNSELVVESLNTILLLNSTVLLSDSAGMNYPSWSISSEMISYFIFGCLTLFTKWRTKYIAAVLLVACAIFLFSVNSYMETCRWGFVRGLLCFITGYYSFLAFKRYNPLTIPAFLDYLMPVLLLFILYIRFHYNHENKLFTMIVIPPFFGFFIFIYAQSKSYLVKLLNTTPLQFLGKISYSVYLNHAVVMLVLFKIAFGLLKLPVANSTTAFVLIAYIILLIIYSYLTYFFIEYKGQKLIKTKIFSRHNNAHIPDDYVNKN